MKSKLKKIKDYLLNLIFPSNIKCIFCKQELNEKAINNTCEKCMASLPFISTCCDRCGLPVIDGFIGVCKRCKNQNYNFAQARSVFIYRDASLNLVRKVKFRSKKVFIPEMAKFMFEKFISWNIKIDYVTFVPMFYKNEKLRGFNQAKELAEEFSKLSNIPTISCCSKILNTPNQRNLSFEKRKENIKGAFKFNKEYKPIIKEKNILIIDDIFTTGATTNELSGVIKQAGAKECYVLTFAHTELK